jgi:AraC family transcriptional regulator
MTDPETLALERLPELVTRNAFRAVGVMSRFDQNSAHAIPALWGRLTPRLPIPGGRGGTLGLCIPGGTDSGDFGYMAGVEMEAGAPTPEGLDEVEVPAQAYAVWRLTINGQALHPQMQAAVRDIWGRRLKTEGLTPSGGPDFELYPPYFDQAEAGQTVEFWIPVEA